MQLPVRQTWMLRLLSQSGEIDIGTLSRKMDVSERTVFREISSVNDRLEKEHIRISVKKSVLTVEGGARNIQRLKQLLGGIPGRLLLTSNQRVLFITAQLLLAEDGCKAAFFSYQLGITEGAVSLCMNHIERWLAERGLMLNRKRGYGIAVEGTEWQKRNAIVTLIYEYKPVDRLLSYLYGVEKDPVLQYFFRSDFGEQAMQTAQAILNLVPQEQSDDISYLTSLLHTMISVEKMISKQPMLLPDNYIQEALSANEAFGKKLREFLTGQNIPGYESEIAYIAVHLPGKYLFEAEHRFQGLNVTVDSLAREVLDEVQTALGTSLNYDGHMVDGVSNDLGRAVYRADMGIHVTNQLLDQVKEHYGELFRAVGQACKLVFSKYNLRFSPDEIGFITMEIGGALETESYLERNLSILILCPNGLFASRILYNKLKSIVRASDRLEVASLKEWSETDRQYDLIISTVSIEPDGKDSRHILVVSQFLSDDDISRIHETVDRIRSRAATKVGPQTLPEPRRRPRNGADGKIVRHILDTLLLQTIPEEPFPLMVDHIAAGLLKDGRVAEQREIVRLFLQRKKAGSVVIPGTRVSLLHIRSDLVKKPFVGIYRLQGETEMTGVGFVLEPVDTFLVMLARGSESPAVLEKMGDISVALIEDQEFPEILRSGGNDILRMKFADILTDRRESEGS